MLSGPISVQFGEMKPCYFGLYFILPLFLSSTHHIYTKSQLVVASVMRKNEDILPHNCLLIFS